MSAPIPNGPVIFDAGVDILSYDAYSYFDKLILYPDHLRRFLDKGGILATGIVPTDAKTYRRGNRRIPGQQMAAADAQLEQLGFSRDKTDPSRP